MKYRLVERYLQGSSPPITLRSADDISVTDCGYRGSKNYVASYSDICCINTGIAELSYITLGKNLTPQPAPSLTVSVVSFINSSVKILSYG